MRRKSTNRISPGSLAGSDDEADTRGGGSDSDDEIEADTGRNGQEQTEQKEPLLATIVQEEEEPGKAMTRCDLVCFFWIPYIFALLGFIGTILLWVGNAEKNFVFQNNVTSVNNTGAYVTAVISPNVFYLVFETYHGIVGGLNYLVYFDSYWDGLRRHYNPWKYAELAVALPMIAFATMGYAIPDISLISLIIVALTEFAFVLLFARLEHSVSIPMDSEYPPSLAKSVFGYNKNNPVVYENRGILDFLMCGLRYSRYHNGLKYTIEKQEKLNKTKRSCKSFPCSRRYDAYDSSTSPHVEYQDEQQFIVKYTLLTLVYFILWGVVWGEAKLQDVYAQSVVYSSLSALVVIHLFLVFSTLGPRCYYYNELFFIFFYESYALMIVCILAGQILQ
jgi:hypothetical protein